MSARLFILPKRRIASSGHKKMNLPEGTSVSNRPTASYATLVTMSHHYKHSPARTLTHYDRYTGRTSPTAFSIHHWRVFDESQTSHICVSLSRAIYLFQVSSRCGAFLKAKQAPLLRQFAAPAVFLPRLCPHSRMARYNRCNDDCIRTNLASRLKRSSAWAILH